MVYNNDDEVVPARLDLPSKNTTFQVIKIVQRICVKLVLRFVLIIWYVSVFIKAEKSLAQTNTVREANGKQSREKVRSSLLFFGLSFLSYQ